jgi:DNA-binding NarL/FixJ family response regulator
MSSPRPKPQIIVMTRYEDKADVLRALKVGAKLTW